ncbi:DNA-processing protein DprA [Brachybacterium sp. EF45031]|uniref:DNA-processing protein DprA n=1 Tax=Brachybacterium sillae TaxID=2810536 RepID=UPI00217D3987|nr:DNA-processing protein DprA [Brachybacterium sillae]MCS6712328.1 DNA-processing protein DprA [Brachybacterium sillae]
MSALPTPGHQPGLRAALAEDEERLARAVWSMLAEPGDDIAHAAVDELGARAALDRVHRGTGAQLLAELPEIPSDGLDPRGSASPDPRQRADAALRRWRARLADLDLDRALGRVTEAEVRLIVPHDPEWPTALGDLGPHTPFCLWAIGPGNAAELNATDRSLAVVGSRASTPYGEDAAHELAAGLAQRGITVVSGGAYGIDAAAHRGALQAGGSTVALLAGGLDALYPPGNAQLLRRIGDEHLLLAESPPGMAPTRWRFLARNRLIAALSGATVVVEAAWRSGALSTARRALEIGREVGAVPGPITAPSSAGCHQLMRDAAVLPITCAEEARALLPGQAPPEEQRRQDELDLLGPAARRVLDALPPRGWATVAALALETGLPPAEVTTQLAHLQLFGRVELREERARRR